MEPELSNRRSDLRPAGSTKRARDATKAISGFAVSRIVQYHGHP